MTYRNSTKWKLVRTRQRATEILIPATRSHYRRPTQRWYAMPYDPDRANRTSRAPYFPRYRSDRPRDLSPRMLRFALAFEYRGSGTFWQAGWVRGETHQPTGRMLTVTDKCPAVYLLFWRPQGKYMCSAGLSLERLSFVLEDPAISTSAAGVRFCIRRVSTA